MLSDDLYELIALFLFHALSCWKTSWSTYISQLLLFIVVQTLSHVWLFVMPWTITHQAPLCMGFSRQEWSRLPFPISSSRDLPNQTHISCIGRWIFFFFFFNPWAIREVHTFLRPLFKVEYIQITCLLLSIVIMSLSSLSQVSERISDKPRVFLRCCSLSLGSRPPQPPAIHSHPSSLQIETPAWIAFMLPCKVYLCQYAPMFVYIHDIPYHLVSDLLSWAITEGLHHSVQQWVDVNKLWPLERGDGMDSGQ